FNPDWFIKQGDTYIIVDTKDDLQISDPDSENIGKSKAANRHFQLINEHYASIGSSVRYKFTFLTPKNYDVFFEKLVNMNIMNFKSELDVKLSD
ncbi:DEAD/DEAH box helicase, partial [Pediococcus pentosaceus]